jgi:periplasmic divalent cation tolerance protein
MTEHNLIYVTAEREAAATIARTLVGERLAACANLLPGVQSFYWWEGALQEDGEAVLVLKTRADLVSQAVDRIKEIHPYQCPCIVVLPVVGGNPAFLAWISAETRPAG